MFENEGKGGVSQKDSQSLLSTARAETPYDSVAQVEDFRAVDRRHCLLLMSWQWRQFRQKGQKETAPDDR